MQILFVAMLFFLSVFGTEMSEFKAGYYVVVANGTEGSRHALPKRCEIVKTYPKNTILEIIKFEKVDCYYMRIRGQVAGSLDWVSIKHIASGYMLLKPILMDDSAKLIHAKNTKKRKNPTEWNYSEVDENQQILRHQKHRNLNEKIGNKKEQNYVQKIQKCEEETATLLKEKKEVESRLEQEKAITLNQKKELESRLEQKKAAKKRKEKKKKKLLEIEMKLIDVEKKKKELESTFEQEKATALEEKKELESRLEQEKATALKEKTELASRLEQEKAKVLNLEEKQNKLREELKCAICYDLMVTPIELPCGHNFCKECLDAHILINMNKNSDRKFPCPICMARFDVRLGFPENKPLSNLSNILKE